MKVFFLIGALCCFAGTSVAQVYSKHRCPSVTVQDNFDINKYMGRWYENRRFFAIFEAFSDCVTADYSLLDDGSVKVNNTGTFRFFNFQDGSTTTAIGNARAEGDVPAKLGVRFSDAQPRGDYWVLETDYTSYTVVWSCTPFEILGKSLGSYQFAWILTREINFPQEKVEALINRMKGFGIDTGNFKVTNQSKNCKRYNQL